MRTNLKLALSFILLAFVFSSCSKQNTPTATLVPTSAGIANPASINCEQEGGKLEIRGRGELGTYGVCVFEDNSQCEEWAMFRGECPEGGVNVTTYITDAAVFCAISGGQYTATGNIGKADEMGTCALKDGTTRDAWDLFKGTSPKK